VKHWPILICLLLGFKVFSTENEPLTFTVGAGYGQERNHWKSLTDTEPRMINFQESYRKVRLVETLGTLRSIQYDFYFLLEGGYGYPFSPRLKEQLVFNEEDVYLSGKASGYQAHSLFLFGYEVNLTPDRFSHFFLTPLVGYAGFWKKFQEKNRAEETLPGLVIDQESNTLKQTWYGPCLGGGIFVQADKFWRFEISYLFDWIDLRHSSHISYNYEAPLLEGSVSQRTKDKKLSAYGHLARAKLLYQISSRWKTALVADYHYFATSNPSICTRTKTKQFAPVADTTIVQERNRLHATEYLLSFLVEISCGF
jgi:hypothetical protein